MPRWAAGPPAPAGGRPGWLLTGAVLAVLGTLLGVSIPENDRLGWADYPAWAAFGVLAALALFVGTVLSSARARDLQLAGAAGVLVFWVFIGLPMVTSNTGFCLTVGGLSAGAILYVSTSTGR